MFEEIESANPELTKVMDNKKPQKYRCDENVLQSAPVVYKQIKVPKSVPSNSSFVTGKQPSVFEILNKYLTCTLLDLYPIFFFIPVYLAIRQTTTIDCSQLNTILMK